MKLVLLIFLYNLFEFKYVKGDCYPSFDTEKSPILLQRFGKKLLFVPNTKDFIFYESTEMIALCPSGFFNVSYTRNADRQYQYSRQNNYYGNGDIEVLTIPTETIILKCIDNKIKVQIEDTLYYFIIGECKSSEKTQLYESSLNKNCEKNHYSIGFNIEDSPIAVAEICLDLDNMRLEYIHYIATLFTPVVSHQILPTKNLKFLTKTDALHSSFFIDEVMTNDLIKNIMGQQAEFLTFKYYELYPSDNLYPYITAPLQSAKNFNKYIGWTNLAEGNWKSFRDLLKSRSKNNTYDVYLGKSDVVSIPTDNCNQLKTLTLKEYTKVVLVPKYVWAYLKSRDNDTEEFVVIGVNSPYFEFYPKNETIFCEDICNEITWLAPLKVLRKKSILGYVFCCRKADVEHKLTGFPKY